MESLAVMAGEDVAGGFRDSLRCPACRGVLADGMDALRCVEDSCGASYPLVRGIPVLLDRRNSLFDVEGILSMGHAPAAPGAPWRRRLEDLVIPSISRNWTAARNYARFFGLLRGRESRPMVLIVGGSTVGEGLRAYLRDPGFAFVESDIYVGPRTTLVSDVNQIPFADGTFDAVIIQAVLEYLPDPARAVAEIHRVLKDDGLVYSETPFMAQVHGGAFDFNRYSHLGHRRLYRMFAEIDSGPSNGPGMALAWSYKYFLMGFFEGRMARNLAHVFAHLTAFWLKYLDGYLIRKAGVYDAALGYYFIGRRSDEALPDSELIKGYRGLWKLR